MSVCLYDTEHQHWPVRHHNVLVVFKPLCVSGVHNISRVNICMAVDEYCYYSNVYQSHFSYSYYLLYYLRCLRFTYICVFRNGWSGYTWVLWTQGVEYSCHCSFDDTMAMTNKFGYSSALQIHDHKQTQRLCQSCFNIRERTPKPTKITISIHYDTHSSHYASNTVVLESRDP